KDKSQLQLALLSWASLWRDILLQASGSQAALTNLALQGEIGQLAGRIGVERALQTLQAIETTQAHLERNANTRLALEVLMLDLPYLRQ
ncbi:MAG: hypothetical protein JW862_12645, partial [Anaerolineales bacterium]|nr:hypothetical protein [Anaerolineales bacterium]